MVDDTALWVTEELDGVTEGDVASVDEIIIVVLSKAKLDEEAVVTTGVELAISATADEVSDSVVEGWRGGRLAMNIVVSANGSSVG